MAFDLSEAQKRNRGRQRMSRIPESVLKAWIAQYLGPQPLANRISDRLKKRAEYRPRHGVRRRLRRIHHHGDAIRLRATGSNLLAQRGGKCHESYRGEFLTVAKLVRFLTG